MTTPKSFDMFASSAEDINIKELTNDDKLNYLYQRVSELDKQKALKTTPEIRQCCLDLGLIEELGLCIAGEMDTFNLLMTIIMLQQEQIEATKFELGL